MIPPLFKGLELIKPYSMGNMPKYNKNKLHRALYGEKVRKAMNTTIKATKEEIINKILEWFDENEEAFNDCIEELDSYNGYLGDDRYYPMYEIDELFHDTNPTELLNRAFFGRDDNSWMTDQYGQKQYDSFNPNREYFYFNGYGNLVSSDYIDYSNFLDHYAVDAMLENRREIWTIDEKEELSALFDELESVENSEEE